jgi:serine protease Do
MKKTAIIAVASFALGLLAAGYIFVVLPEKTAQAGTSPASVSAPPAGLSATLYASTAPEVRTNQDFATIAEKAGPAVIRIDAERRDKIGGFGLGDNFGSEDFWDRFFGRPAPRNEKEVPSLAQGTGFFISADGYVLTNNHIVENAVKVTVFTVSGNEYEAKVIGTDSKTDIALLKINAKDLPSIELGDSAELRIGEWVLAIGNPYGFEHTVTAGIVSAKGRQFETGTFQDFIQTDAAINRGNSGGPLINMRGQVVGITSSIYTPTGGNIGIGFAIPSNMVKKVVAQLKDKGRVVRGYLGIVPQEVTEGIRKQFNLKDRKGAIVSSVEADSPAGRAGLKQYDVITAINGQPVENVNDLRFKIADVEPGKKAALTVTRDGKETTITATVEELEPEQEKGQTPSADKNLGLSITPLTPNLARRYGLKTTEGLLITQVEDYSEAARKGLEPGMVILEVNRQKVMTIREFENVLKKTSAGDEIILLVRIETDGRAQEAIITLRVPG